MKETTWQQDAAKVLNALTEHESEPPVRVQPVVRTPVDNPFCCRCKEDFPLAKEPANFQMGEMREIRRAPGFMRRKFQEWCDHDTGRYLCGNCYFDLLDEQES